MEDLLPPTNDFVFKRIFGDEQHTDVLLAFVNAIFADTKQELLEHIAILNPALEKTAVTDKLVILDIRARTHAGDFINIEIQVANQRNIIKRALAYWSKLYFGQMSSGDSYHLLKRIISIAALDFTIRPSPHYHAYFRLVEYFDAEALYDLDLHFLELKKLQQATGKEKDSELYWWLRFIKGMKREELEAFKMRNMSAKKAVELLEYLSQNPEVRQQYEDRQKALRDERSRLETAHEDGLEEGIVQGREEGISQGILQGREEGMREKALQMAKALLVKGMSAAEVAEITELPAAEVRKLRPRKSK